VAEELPPGTPEVDDPLLVADLIALLSIKGAIGRLPLADIVLPVVNLGDVVTPQIEVLSPVYQSTDVFSAGQVVNPALGAVLADTGALIAGVYDLIMYGAALGVGTANLIVQHRNAANTATLAEWEVLFQAPVGEWFTQPLPRLSYQFGDNERLRIITRFAEVGSEYATIFAVIRS